MALAKAANMEVEEVEKQLAIRDKLSGLSGEQLEKANKLIKNGVDIRDLSDDELKAQAENLANTEKLSGVMSGIQSKIGAIVEQFGGRMAPLIESLGKGLLFILGIFAQIGDLIKYMQENTWAMVAGSVIMGTLATAYLAMKLSSYLLERKITQEKRKQLGPEIATASASIFGGFGKLGPWGIAGAIAAIAVMTAGAYALLSKGDDVYSPAQGSGGYGKRALMEEGSITLLNNRDSVVAGTDLFSNPAQSKSSPMQSSSPIAASNNNMIGALINEFRGVRADMASGKIGVYMDSERVTSNVTRTIDNSTRNNFALV